MAHECLERRRLTDKRPIIADRDNLYGPRARCPGSDAWVWRASAKARRSWWVQWSAATNVAGYFGPVPLSLATKPA